jgi:hypothetical protein
MKRIFSNLLAALFIGACLRLFFMLKFPAGSGDTVIYEQIASNWARHGMYAMDIAGQPASVDLRMPGYPAFLATIYALTGKFAENARRLVMFAQVVVDLVSCVAAGALAALLTFLCNPRADTQRGFLAGLWLAALCPFTANYVAVPLTEVWATFFTTLAFCMLSVLAISSALSPGERELFEQSPGLPGWMRRFWVVVVVSGFVVGVGTLFRPETPLLIITTSLLLAYCFLRNGQLKRMVVTLVLLGVATAAPLLPWMIRNAVTLHEFQALAPKDTNLPGEVDPKGFMAWERTWLYRFRDNYLVPWKLNEEAIRLEDLPANAFDTEDEKNRVAAVLDTYNQELNWTPEEDAVFAQLARERTARHPLRTSLWIPLRRAVRIWFTPRIELIPVSGHVFPLRYMHEEDPVDQRVTILYFFGNIIYVGLGLWGAWRLWRCNRARPAVAVILFYILVRTMFLTTLETPEPRYVLVCFPALFAFGAQLFARIHVNAENRRVSNLPV